jgi:hypothetical protein
MGVGTTAQQLRIAADLVWDARWKFAWDMNGDGAVTFSDAWLWLKWVFFASIILAIRRAIVDHQVPPRSVGFTVHKRWERIREMNLGDVKWFRVGPYPKPKPRPTVRNISITKEVLAPCDHICSNANNAMRATNATRIITPRAGCMVRMPRVNLEHKIRLNRFNCNKFCRMG